MPVSSSVDNSPRSDTDLQVLQKRSDCGSSPTVFSTARCLLRRGSNNPGPRVAITAESIWAVTNDLWKQLVQPTQEAGLLQTGMIGGLNAVILIGWQDPNTNTFTALEQRVTAADLWSTILGALWDAVDNSPGITTYYIASHAGEALASLTIYTSLPYSSPSFSSFPVF
ncbi:MAG: hypothetical protein M1840_007974 [Geoglossum simile]|nr:MAG: hypothetical protein M1840_007974 [Geoglossum simile]